MQASDRDKRHANDLAKALCLLSPLGHGEVTDCKEAEIAVKSCMQATASLKASVVKLQNDKERASKLKDLAGKEKGKVVRACPSHKALPCVFIKYAPCEDASLADCQTDIFTQNSEARYCMHIYASAEDMYSSRLDA